MKEPLVSLIIPAYRQEKTIVNDLKRIRSIADRLRYPVEIICVDDGSDDQTFSRASMAAKKQLNTHVVGYSPNQGKGYAIKYGMSKSHGQIIAFIDAGMDIDPNGLSMLLEHFEWYKADIIVGSKRHPASKVTYPWQRHLLSMGYQTLVWLMFGLKVRDTQVGIKFFRRQVIQKVLPRLLVKRYAFDIELLAVANYLGFTRIYEAPVDVRLDFGGASTLTSKKFVRTVYNMLWDTLAVFYRLHILHYYSDSNSASWSADPHLDIGRTR